MTLRQVDAVITSLGAVTGAGDEVATRRLQLQGGCAVRPFADRDHEGLPPGYGAPVAFAQKDLRELPGGKAMRPGTMTLHTFLAVSAAGRALLAAGIGEAGSEPEATAERRGVIMGSYTNFPELPKHLKLTHSMASPGAAAQGRYEIDDARAEPGMRGFTGFDFLKLMNNMPVAHTTIQAAARGPANTILGHCAAGLQAIGRAWDALLLGQADQVVTGATGPGTIEGLCLVRRGRRCLASPGLDPATAARPLDAGASGIVPGDAGAAFLLETASCAEARGARPLARLVGWDERLVAPQAERGPLPDHRGIVRLLRSVLDRAGWRPGQVDLLSATGAGLPELDAVEAAAIAEVFGVEHASACLVVHTGVVGFTEAAHGPLGLALAMLAMRDGLLASNVGMDHPVAPLAGLTPRPRPVPADVRRALVLSVAPEGTMAALAAERVGPA